MELRDLKLFLNLADALHFGKAAKKSYVSPSTLSRQIQRVEEELSQPLFIRNNRTVELTHAGLLLKQFAQQTLLSYQQLKQQMQLNDSVLKGELKIFCSVTAAYSHLPTILDKFREQYPSVEIKLMTGDAADAVDKILSDNIDLAIAGRPESLPAKISFTGIGNISLVLIIPTQLCPVRQQVLQAKPLWQKIPFILPEHGPSRRYVDRWFHRRHISHPTIYATVAGHEAIVSMVALGCGVALIPKVVVDHSSESIRSRIEIIEMGHENFELGVCTQKKRLNEPLIHAFWQLL